MLNTNLIQESIIVEALQVAFATYVKEALRAVSCNQLNIAEVFNEKANRVCILRTLIESGDVTKQRVIT